MNFKPLYNYILVIPEKAEETTKSGIIIPDIAKQPPGIGIVKAVGTSIDAIKKGDRVLYYKNSGTEVTVDETEHLVLKADETGDVIAIL